MKLKEWPTDDLSYVQALRQITKFINLFKGAQEDSDGLKDYTDALEIYEKLIKEIYETYKIDSTEAFWHWCYSVTARQLEEFEDRILTQH